MYTADLIPGDRVALCGWDDFFGTVLEAIPADELDDEHIKVEWDRMNDDGNYIEWVSPLTITRAED